MYIATHYSKVPRSVFLTDHYILEQRKLPEALQCPGTADWLSPQRWTLDLSTLEMVITPKLFRWLQKSVTHDICNSIRGNRTDQNKNSLRMNFHHRSDELICYQLSRTTAQVLYSLLNFAPYNRNTNPTLLYKEEEVSNNALTTHYYVINRLTLKM